MIYSKQISGSLKEMLCRGSSDETDLGGILNTDVGDSEGVDSPVQVESMLGFAERQPLPQCSLIDLDHSNTGLLEVLHFILDCQGNLVTGFESENQDKRCV